MKYQLASLLLAVAACSSQTSTVVASDSMVAVNNARVELVEQGGIAALESSRIVRHDDRFFSYVQRHLCGTGNCGAPIDTAAGSLSPAAADSLFGIVLAASPLTLNEDYGTTKGGADMVAYTLTVFTLAGTRTIHADDGTMPAPMRRIINAVHGIVGAARK